MSWAEYKKKREEQENMEMSYSQENNDSNNETSSWQKYKQKREEQKVQQTETLPVANKANTAPKTTTNLTEADLRKIEQNSGLKTGTLNLNKMQAQQQKFENLQQKGNEILQDKNNKIYDVDYIYSDLGIDNGKVFKKSSAFKDGYDFGDITKTVLDTGATLGTEVTKGVANIGENIGDLASYGIAGVADLLGKDEYADKVRKNAQVSLVDKYTKPLSSKIDKNSILGSKGKEMAQSLGYVAGTAAIGTATGGTAGILGKTAEGAAKAANIATTATTFASSMGSGITEAYQNGATDQEALAYGIISGIGEAGSELMFGGLGKVFGKVGFNPTGGALDEVVVQGLSRNIKNKMVKTLVQSGLMATGEGIEEVVSGVVSAIGKKATFMKEEDLKNILKDENLAEQFWMGTLTSVIAQAPSTISSIKNKTDYLTGEKWETTQKNKTPELPQNVQNNIEQQTIQTDTKTAQNQNMSQISGTNENNLKNTAINEVNSGQTTQNQEIPQLNNILNNKELPMQSYIYEKSDNPNVDILRKSASKYLNNSEQAHKFVQILEKISQDKNVEIRFDADLKTPEGKIANGSYSNGVITINPNSTRAGEFIAIHELTHAIGTKQMENIIEKYSKSNIEFNEETKKLLQNYSNTEMNEEALADISGQLFGTQEFINNISQNNPNIFQRIYSEIKYLWHQFKGYKTQDQFIDDLYYKWTQAYNSNNKLNNTENYHVSENFSSEIDKALNNKLQANTQVKARDYTPQILVDNGVDNLPMLITQRHIKSTIYTLQEAENLGLPTKNVNYHGLGKDLLIKAIDNLDSPQAIYKTSENNYLVVTEFKDNNGKEIVIPIQINGNGRYNNVFIDENQIKSVYGRNNLNNYINKNNFEQIYKKNEELDFNEGIQYSNVANSSIKDSITPQNENVNTTTKYSMQESENNSGSFKFDNKGRELSKEQQEYFKNSKVRDENGNLQVMYHGSPNEFTVFDRSKSKSSGEFGKGLYFTSDESIAKGDYSKDGKVYEVYLNVNNPLVDGGERTLTKKDIKQLVTEIANNEDYGIENYGYDATIDSVTDMLDEHNSDFKILNDLNLSTVGDFTELVELTNNVIGTNYDGIQNYRQTVVFNPNQIKNVDNTNPSLNLDIRYSQNNKTWQDYLEKNYKTTGTRTNMQDILVSKATNNNKERVRDILSRNGSFSEQVDKYIADKLPSGDFLYLGETPTVLQNLGLPNNEVILKQSKLKTLMQESNNNTDKLHELPIETIKKIPEAIANPLNILQSSTDENSVVIITDLADANERPIIASIEVNYDGQIGNIDFLSNRLTSAYGKNNYDRFMKTEIAKGNLLYDIDEGIIKELPATRLQSPKGISSFVDTNNNVSTINDSISQNNNSVKSNTIITNNYAQQTQNDTHNNQNVAPSVANNSLPVGEYTGKQRKHYKSIMESAETTPQAKKIAKELLNSDTYVPETNKGQLERADARIMSSTPESELNSLSAKAINGEKISSVDIAVGERLIQYYSKTGNAVKLQEAIQTTAMAGTSAGQTVQALSLLNHQTPQGQAMWLQKSVDKMNNELARRKGGKISKDENGNIRVINNKGVDITEKVELFNLTPEMIQNVVSSKNDTELNNNLNKVYEQLGQQVTRTTAQKIDAWRYFSMLANPKTHIRNITGNVAMGGVQGIKNKVAGAIEGVVNKINPDMERSHTIKPASKEVKAFAKADIENVTDRLGLSENKYNPKTRLENSMRTFKSDVMENTVGKMFDLNNKALEVEDGWGLKAGYAKALSEYMTANNLTPDTITDKQLGKARNYAIQQAKEATFHQDSSIASLLNQLSNKNKFSKFILDATLPFKKTPVNVAKAGLEYSPVGLVKSAIYDTVQLRKGNITVNTYIDNVSKGLTGSGIALVGYALADCGILKATGSDDEDREKFEESRGSQNYSVKIGDNTYSLDWLAPAGIPLFIGAECYELMQAQKEKKTSSSDEDELYNKAINTATNILDSFANAMNPMTEMSMLSGLTSALKSYDQDSSKILASIGTNAVKSYVNQFVPTALGQVAKTTDQYERSTTSTQKGVLPKAIDTTRTQIMNKIPGLRQMLPIKTDIWGNEIEQSDNVIQRAFENAVFPWARKELNSNSVDKELVKVYKNTGDKAVLPDSINKEITINKQKYTMTSGEYSKYKKQYGENSYKLLNSLVTANGYKKMSDEEKRVAISKIYSYATEQIKVDYAKQNGLEYEQSTLTQVTNAIKKVNGNTSNYFEFIAKTQELDKDIEKIKTLANSNYDENTKKAIYENSLGKRDNKFNIMKETFTTNGLNTTKYLKYKSQEFESDKTDDGTLNGKTVNGSKKKKVWNYIEQMDITYTQKLLLYGLEYTPSNREQTQIVNYINSLPKTQQEKLEMLSKFQGFTIYKDGTFKF